MNNFSYFSTVRTMFNNDLKEGLAQARKVLGVKKAMILTDPGVAALPIWQEMQQAMKEIDFSFELFEQVKPNPTDVTMEQAADALKATDCDCVIGFGGGSAIDTAKAAALLATNPGSLRDYYGMNKVQNKCLPTIMVTTTAGSYRLSNPRFWLTPLSVCAAINAPSASPAAMAASSLSMLSSSKNLRAKRASISSPISRAHASS